MQIRIRNMDMFEETEREVLFCAYKILRREAGWAAENTDEGLQVGSLVSSQALQQ